MKIVELHTAYFPSVMWEWYVLVVLFNFCLTYLWPFTVYVIRSRHGHDQAYLEYCMPTQKELINPLCAVTGLLLDWYVNTTQTMLFVSTGLYHIDILFWTFAFPSVNIHRLRLERHAPCLWLIAIMGDKDRRTCITAIYIYVSWCNLYATYLTPTKRLKQTRVWAKT